MSENPLMSFTPEEVERAKERSRKKFEMDIRSDFATAYDNGFKAGLKEVSIEAAQKLLTFGLPVGQIATITSLTVEEVEGLSQTDSQSDFADPLDSSQGTIVRADKKISDIDFARNLFKYPLPSEQIAQLSGLTLEEVERLRTSQ